MKYSVIKINGNQYKVTEGEELLIDRVAELPKAEVLLSVDGDSVVVGTPSIDSLKVTMKMLDEEVKGEKIIVQKYKSKSRYRRRNGFRALYSRVLIEKISK